MEPRQVDRRTVLAGSAAAGAALVLGGVPGLGAPAGATGTGRRRPPRPPVVPTSGPFRLGVASGDPSPDGVVLWTRLAPDPLAPRGGMAPGAAAVPVEWEVSRDERFRRVEQRGTAAADPAAGYSVHAEVPGLRPGRWYWYRFRSGREISPVGRTRTAPRPGAGGGRLRFAFASCQQWQAGFFTAHAAMAAEDLDLVVFLGDYIYEGVIRDSGPRPDTVPEPLRPEPVDVEGYRARYALYRLDPNLQAAHAAFPWVVTLDDHEVDNNWADEVPQDPTVQSRTAFLARRAAAFRAYYEHMPLRAASIPRGVDMQVYRRLSWGDLATFHVLDTRQYRSDQVLTRADATRPERSILGTEQEAWLADGLARSSGRWNVLAQQVFLSENDRQPGPEDSFDFDNWDGYLASRARLFDTLVTRRPSNPIVLTGDRHYNWVADLQADVADPASPILGTEFVGTAISTGGDEIPGLADALYDPVVPESPHWRYFDAARGYVRCEVRRKEWETDLRVVDAVSTPEATVSTRASFVVEDGVPGVTQTAGPAIV